MIQGRDIIERTDVALGGAERSISEVADALSVLGLEVHLLAAKGAACKVLNYF